MIMDYKNLIIESKKIKEESHGMFLFSWIEFDDDYYLELINLASDILAKNPNILLMKKEKEYILALALTKFALLEYQEIDKKENEDLYFQFLHRVNYSTNNIMEFKERIFKTFEEETNVIEYIDINRKTKNRRFVDTALMQNVVNNYSIEKILKIVVMMYFKNLKENMNYRHVLNFIKSFYVATRAFIMNDRKSNDQTLSYTYYFQQLPISFLYAFYYSPEKVKEVLMDWFSYIHAINCNETPVYKKNPHTLLFKNNEELAIIHRIIRSEKSLHRKNNSFRKQIGTNNIELHSNKIYLKIAPYLINYKNEDKYLLRVYVDKKLERTIPLDVIEEDSQYYTENKTIILPLSHNIQYFIVNKDETIYDSKNNYVREYYLFNHNGHLCTVKELKDNRLFTVISKNIINSVGDKTNDSHKTINDLNIFETFMGDQKEVVINNYRINNIKTHYDNGIDPTELYENVLAQIENKEYKAIKSFNSFYIKISKQQYISDFRININEKHYDLKDLNKFNIVSQKGEEIVVSIDLQKVLRLIDMEISNFELISIQLIEKGKEIIPFSENYVLIEEMSFRFDKDNYTNEKHVILEEFSTKNNILKINTPQKHPTNNRGIFSINTHNIKLIFTLPTVKINEKTIYPYEIWHEDFKIENLATKGFLTNPLWKFEVSQEKAIIRLGKDSIHDGFTYYNLSNLEKLTSIHELILVNGDKESSILKIVHDPVIKGLQPIFQNDNLVVRTDFIGPKNLIIRFSIPELNINISKKLDDTVVFEGVQSGYFAYQLEIILLKKKLIGKPTEIILHSEKFNKGDSLIIDSKKSGIKFNQIFSDEEVYELNNFYIKLFKKLNEEEYLGHAFHNKLFNNERKEVYYDTINPVKLTSLYSDEDIQSFQVCDKDGEVLMYDKQTRFINLDTRTRDYERYCIVDEIIISKGLNNNV